MIIIVDRMYDVVFTHLILSVLDDKSADSSSSWWLEEETSLGGGGEVIVVVVVGSLENGDGGLKTASSSLTLFVLVFGDGGKMLVVLALSILSMILIRTAKAGGSSRWYGRWVDRYGCFIDGC